MIAMVSLDNHGLGHDNQDMPSTNAEHKIQIDDETIGYIKHAGQGDQWYAVHPGGFIIGEQSHPKSEAVAVLVKGMACASGRPAVFDQLDQLEEIIAHLRLMLEGGE